MRRLILIPALALLSLIASALCFAQAQQPPKRHRIAVLDFNDASVANASQSVFGRKVDVGKGVTDLLIDRLVSDGAYRVVERDRIDKILTEQNFLHSNLADPATAAKVGHRLGVDAVVVGEVTQFGWQSQPGKPEVKPGKPARSKGADGATQRSARAMVAITAELIDTNTGQMLASATSNGVSKRSGTKLLDGTGAAGPGGVLAMDSSSFAQSMIGSATTAAVNQMAKELESQSARLPRWAPPPLRGEITDASTAAISINVGSAAGLKVGDKMLVTRVVRDEMDEGKTPVGSIEDEVGELTITSVQQDSAVGRFSGPEKPHVGDRVRPLQ